MKFHFQHAFRALILLTFSAYIFSLHLTGDIYKYINPKYEMISMIAVVIFAILFIIQLQRIWESKHDHEHCNHHHCDHDHGYSRLTSKTILSYGIIIFPLLTGFMLPPKTLDSSIAEKKGVLTLQSNASKNENNSSEKKIDAAADDTLKQQDEIESEEEAGNTHDQASVIERNYMSQEKYDSMIAALDEISSIQLKNDNFYPYYELISMEPEKHEGKKINLIGFVYKEDGFSESQFVISRFLIMHCVADASVIGFLSESVDAQEISEDTWVEIEGELTITTYNETQLPTIKVSKWEEIEEPNNPYVYPVYTKIK